MKSMGSIPLTDFKILIIKKWGWIPPPCIKIGIRESDQNYLLVVYKYLKNGMN